MVLNNHTLPQQKALVILPECVSADSQSSYCQEPVTVWRIISGQELDWVAEKTFQRLPQRVPQRPGHNPSSWESFVQDRPTWLSKVTTGAPCGRKLTDLSGTASKWPRAKPEQPPLSLWHPHTHVPCVGEPYGLGLASQASSDSPSIVLSLKSWSPSTFFERRRTGTTTP